MSALKQISLSELPWPVWRERGLDAWCPLCYKSIIAWGIVIERLETVYVPCGCVRLGLKLSGKLPLSDVTRLLLEQTGTLATFHLQRPRPQVLGSVLKGILISVNF